MKKHLFVILPLVIALSMATFSVGESTIKKSDATSSKQDETTSAKSKPCLIQSKHFTTCNDVEVAGGGTAVAATVVTAAVLKARQLAKAKAAAQADSPNDFPADDNPFLNMSAEEINKLSLEEFATLKKGFSHTAIEDLSEEQIAALNKKSYALFLKNEAQDAAPKKPTLSEDNDGEMSPASGNSSLRSDGVDVTSETEPPTTGPRNLTQTPVQDGEDPLSVFAAGTDADDAAEVLSAVL